MSFLGKQTKFDDDAGYYFNMLNESTKSVSSRRNLAESNKLKENSSKEYRVKFYQIFKAPEKPTEKGKMVAQVGADENPWEKADKMLGKGNAFVMAVCDDGKKRYVDRDYIESNKRSINEKVEDKGEITYDPNKGIVYLQYYELPVLIYNRRYNDYDEEETQYEHKVSIEDVYEMCLGDEIVSDMDNDEYSEHEEHIDEYVDKYMRENTDELLDKYKNRILDTFEDLASEKASEYINDHSEDRYLDYYESYEKLMNESKPRFKLGSERHQNVGVNNRYNYTIQQIDIDNENKTFMRGDTKIVSDKVFKNKQEYEDFIDDLKKKGYKEVENKSQPDFSYRSLRNGSRKGAKTEGQESMKVRESVRKIGKPMKRKVNESMSGKWSEYLYDLIDADAIDTKWLSYAFTKWLSESKVEEFMRDNDILMDDDYDIEESFSNSSIEKKKYPFYVTYYEESPAYSPAEGGYYYAVVEAVESKGFNTRKEAREYLKQIADEYDLLDIVDDDFCLNRSRYIGESSYAYVETSDDYLSREYKEQIYN